MERTISVWSDRNFRDHGRFPFNPKVRNFGWYTKWNGPFRFGPTGIVGTSFEGGLVWPVWSFRSVGPKRPFPFDKIVVYSAALLHPAYKNNNQTRGGLGGVCATGMHSSIGHVKFLKFQTGIFVEWKAPLLEGSPIWPVWPVWSVGRTETIPFHYWTKLLSLVPLFCILLPRTIT